jgi:inner membrane protein
MDNVTHSLAGMLVAEAACQWHGESRARVRATTYLVSALANNLPDIDIAYSWAMGPQPLGNLLHHRGHTHTLLLALPGAWLLASRCWRWLSKREASLGTPEKRLIFGVSLLGVLMHLLMDFGNNYGVHPFWPLSARWFYGDSIFIIEPSWWAIAIPLLAAWLEKRWLKVGLCSLLLAVLLVCWFVPFVLPASRFALLGLTGTSLAVVRFGSQRQRLAYALGGCLAVAALFATGSALARAELRRATISAFPALDVRDVALTPLPANPACWEGLVAGEQGGEYRVIRASVALAPLGADGCAAGDDVVPSAPVERLSRATHGGVRFRNQYRAKLSELRQLAADDCRFRALLRFTRLPYVALKTASPRYAGDLRYDRAPDQDFSDIVLAPPTQIENCPRFVPGWTPPRAELLER